VPCCGRVAWVVQDDDALDLSSHQIRTRRDVDLPAQDT
jgi:hypothetical protein